jgi:hypothetical protein
MKHPKTLLAMAALCGPMTLLAYAQFEPAAEHHAIAYTASVPTDAIARLQRNIDMGTVTLDFEPQHGYLASLLRTLDVPVSSQGLVFSKTSFQAARIGPWAPRALYFNDEIYVGEVRGSSLLEIASVDPKLGAVFYTLDQQPSARPVFQRQGATCLQCHDSSSATGGVPGLLFRSVATDRAGSVLGIAGAGVTTDRTPLDQRWGGWYVTGSGGTVRHMGNPDLGRFDPARLLAPDSDIVALMVFAHQARVHNLITSAGYSARISGSTDQSRAAAERLVQALLFVNEAPISSPIKGSSGFAGEFAARGPRDRQGRTLYELDLKRRMFKYRLSYLIYSKGFDGLPASVKDYVYQRVAEVLTGTDQSETFSDLTPSERKAILEILRDTKPDFAQSLTLATSH